MFDHICIKGVRVIHPGRPLKTTRDPQKGGRHVQRGLKRSQEE